MPVVADLSCQLPCINNARDVDAGGTRRALSPELRPEASLSPPSATVALTADVRTLVTHKVATLVPAAGDPNFVARLKRVCPEQCATAS